MADADRPHAVTRPTAPTDSSPTYFDSPAAFRTWLARHAATEQALVVGFHKVGSGRPSLTWPEAVDEALCVGWIDGVRKRIDDARYQIRFTPRKATSTWSAVNIARMEALADDPRMTDGGRAAFDRRTASRSGTYAYEQKQAAALADDEAATFRGHRNAWTFFAAQPPGYRQRMLWRIVSAKQPTTRARRLAALIAASAEGRRLD